LALAEPSHKKAEKTMVASLGAVGAVLGGLTGLAPAAGKLLELVAPIVDRLIPDPERKQQLLIELVNALAKFDVAQLEVNRTEAQHASIFVAGWRPFIGWVLGLGVAYSFLLAPLIGGIIALWKPGFALPAVDDHLWELIFAMLGMGALRSFDKLRGIDAGRVPAASPPWKGSLPDAIRDPRA
jgi:hypothetical protein